MEKANRWKLKKPILFLFWGLILVGFIGFIENKAGQKTFSGLEVYIKGISDVYFVDEKEVISLLKNAFPALEKNGTSEEIPLHELEKMVENHPFIKNAEVFMDLRGKVIVKVSQHVPLARIVRPLAADGYISMEGKILPTSSKYTSRVVVIEGRKATELLQQKDLTASHPDLMNLLHFIDRDKFWKAQISGMEIQVNGDVNLNQQVGKQTIEFGKPKEIELKFKKINTFYKKIVPLKGWNTYSRVNVKFKDQIICE
ncbi:MAG: cell division protein [Cyclobacteriaceae bacterium]